MKLRSIPEVDPQKLFWIDNFLRPSECKAILHELQFSYWSPSTVLPGYPVAGVHGVRSPGRVSESTREEWFTPQLRRMVWHLQKKLSPFVSGLRSRRECWQATSYGKGGKFDYHYDCGRWTHDPAGDRSYTVLIYLNTPRRGGSTRFLAWDLDVKATAGRVLVWRNLTADGLPDRTMLHCSVPLSEGRKTVLVTWVRQRKFRKTSTTSPGSDESDAKERSEEWQDRRGATK
jgi:prolyl 4-hydroxylase